MFVEESMKMSRFKHAHVMGLINPRRACAARVKPGSQYDAGSSFLPSSHAASFVAVFTIFGHCAL